MTIAGVLGDSLGISSFFYVKPQGQYHNAIMQCSCHRHRFRGGAHIMIGPGPLVISNFGNSFVKKKLEETSFKAQMSLLVPFFSKL